MHVALMTSHDQPPAYREHPEPVARAGREIVVDVLAAGLHHLTRARASGLHYSTAATLPLVPGADGVVRDPDGRLRYAALDDTRLGTFAERTVIDVRRSILLPDDVDPVQIAAAMNPGMSSWVALRRRITFRPGQSVLVLGATGSAGRMAVQVARLLGAARVVAVGRNTARLAELPALGADDAVTFDEVARAADVDVVLDLVWGEPAAGAMLPLLTARTDRSVPLTWVQIGSVAGSTAPVPSVALRSSRLEIVGSGIGSVSPREILEELPGLVAAVHDGAVDVRARAVPLAQIEQEWTTTSSDERLVVVP